MTLMRGLVHEPDFDCFHRSEAWWGAVCLPHVRPRVCDLFLNARMRSATRMGLGVNLSEVTGGLRSAARG
jgi:hypothetical protein